MKKILKASTKTGYRWIISARNYEGYNLNDVYGRYSNAKKEAYEKYENCFRKYASADGSKNFRIFSHNTFGFSVAWEEIWEGEECLHIETPQNTYIVVLNQ